MSTLFWKIQFTGETSPKSPVVESNCRSVDGPRLRPPRVLRSGGAAGGLRRAARARARVLPADVRLAAQGEQKDTKTPRLRAEKKDTKSRLAIPNFVLPDFAKQ